MCSENQGFPVNLLGVFSFRFLWMSGEVSRAKGRVVSSQQSAVRRMAISGQQSAVRRMAISGQQSAVSNQQSEEWLSAVSNQQSVRIATGGRSYRRRKMSGIGIPAYRRIKCPIFTEFSRRFFTDVGGPWVAKTQYSVSP